MWSPVPDTRSENDEATAYLAMLEDVRILDFTHALAGPFSTQMLADLGADVIKIEPFTGDLTRRTPPHFIDGSSLYFHALNRNKHSLALDLKTQGGQRVLHDLVPLADIVMLNFSPGVAGRLGLTHDRLVQLNPRIITCALSSFGPHYAGNARGTDMIVQATAGAMSITGHPGGPPARAAVPTGDLSAGFYSAVAVLAGLHHRERTGRGIALDTSLFHSQLSLLSYMGAYSARTGTTLPQLGSGYPATVPAQAFQASDGGWLVIDAGADAHFRSLCTTLGREDLRENPDFATRSSRLAAKGELIKELQRSFLTRPRDEWVELLREAGVPAGQVYDMHEALHCEAAAEGALAPMEIGAERVEVLRTPIWVEDSSAHRLSAPPQIGESTRSVLSGLLSYDDSQIAKLADEGAIACRYDPTG